MTREKHLVITAFHEIGHYLLVKRFNKLFPNHFIYVCKIELYFEDDNPHYGDVTFAKEKLKISDASNEMLKGFINIDLAGFVAPTLFYNIVYNKNNIKLQNDYCTAYEVANILRERYLLKRIDKTAEDILKEQWFEVKKYLNNNKYLLYALALRLYNSKVLYMSDLETIEEKFSL